MEQEQKQEYISLRLLLRRIIEHKKTYFRVLPIVFVLACAYTLCIPRYYISDIKLVPEMGGMEMGGTLGSLASSFGIDLSNSQSSDAINPLLYPDLMEDNGFAHRVSKIKVKSAPGADMEVDTTYYAYLKSYQKRPFWSKAISSVKKLFKKKQKKGTGSGEYDPYNISEDENGIYSKLRDNVIISVDKKTAVITISVTAQDPYICKTMADSIKNLLQDFIIEYRTTKARVDMDYYKSLADEAKANYEKVRRAYAAASDANTDVLLKSVSSEVEDLENEMQLRYNAYSTMEAQYQSAVAKVQERTPAFTLLKGAQVPVKHAGPKRMIMVAMMTFLAFIVVLLWTIKDDLKLQLNFKS